MMKRKRKSGKLKGTKKNIVIPTGLFLVGLTLLFDALGAGFVFFQLPQNIFGSSATLIWTYIIVRFIAGLVALIAGAVSLGK